MPGNKTQTVSGVFLSNMAANLVLLIGRRKKTSQNDKKTQGKLSRFGKLLLNRNFPPHFTYVKKKLTSILNLEKFVA